MRALVSSLPTLPPPCPLARRAQVTINCAERGLLLLRVRDQLRMVTAAYQTLYESSVAFGMRKALQVTFLLTYGSNCGQ